MLKDTGERVIPEKMKITNSLLIEHVARYHFACKYVHGRVLDFASGTGYGSHIIAKNCKEKIDEIIGIDHDKDVIAYAKHNYYHPLTTFLKEDVTDPHLPKKIGQFDTIISFETMEHIPDEKQFLSNIYRLLEPQGTLILSTPFGKGRGIESGYPFHVHQLTINEFRNSFNPYASTNFFFQTGALIEPANFDTDNYYPLGIAVCKK